MSYHRKPVISVNPRLLSLRQAAEYLGISVDTLRRMVTAGEIARVRRPGPWTRWLFDKADLDRWIEANKNVPVG